MKTYVSASEKARRRNIPIESLHDLAGARIVVGTLGEVEVVRRFFTRQQLSSDLTVEKDLAIEREDGYRSHHVVVRYPPRYSRSPFSASIEIQIPTIFQHSFNYLSRAWTYKTDASFTPTWEEEFKRLSAQLRNLDQLAAKLHEEVDRSATSKDPSAPLSPFSYRNLVLEEFGETVKLDDAVDSCRFLTARGFTTNGQFVTHLRNPETERLWSEFILRAEKGHTRALNFTRSKAVFWDLFGIHPEAASGFFED